MKALKPHEVEAVETVARDIGEAAVRRIAESTVAQVASGGGAANSLELHVHVHIHQVVLGEVE